MRVRREKLAAYKEQGLNPFGGKFTRTHVAKELHALYHSFSKEELETKNEHATIAGRVMTKRGKGKVGFAHLQDSSGQIQIYVRKDEIGEEAYKVFKTIDRKSTRLNSSNVAISYAVFCLKKKKK